MKQLIEVPTEEGTILVEVTPDMTAAKPAMRATSLDDTVEKSAKSLAEGLNTIMGIAADFRKKIDGLAGVDAAELHFGLKLTAKGSVYVVETAGEASFSVKLTFKQRS